MLHFQAKAETKQRESKIKCKCLSAHTPTHTHTWIHWAKEHLQQKSKCNIGEGSRYVQTSGGFTFTRVADKTPLSGLFP